MGGKDLGWALQPDHQLGARHGQALTGTDVKRNALPAPRINLELQSREGLHVGHRRYPLLRPVAAKLPANYRVRSERRDCFEDFDLLIADRLAVGPDGRFHRQIRQDLEQMVLYNITNCAGLIVERSAA